MNISEKHKVRFWRSVDKTPGCWLWIAGKSSAGYGRICVNGRPVYAHRLSAMMHFGQIPDGLEVMHKCDNPACVNPDHLVVGTHAENMGDRDRKGRGRTCLGKTCGELHPLARLKANDIIEIRSDHRSNMEIAASYKISRGYVGDIKRRRSWAHV